MTLSLEKRTSRRGFVGRVGKAVVATGAALAGVAGARPVSASCGGGSCTETQYTGDCTGIVYSCTSCEVYGWSWFCCDDLHRQWKCQDCCDPEWPHGYLHTCRIYMGQCGWLASWRGSEGVSLLAKPEAL